MNRLNIRTVLSYVDSQWNSDRSNDPRHRVVGCRNGQNPSCITLQRIAARQAARHFRAGSQSCRSETETARVARKATIKKNGSNGLVDHGTQQVNGLPQKPHTRQPSETPGSRDVPTPSAHVSQAADDRGSARNRGSLRSRAMRAYDKRGRLSGDVLPHAGSRGMHPSET